MTIVVSGAVIAKIVEVKWMLTFECQEGIAGDGSCGGNCGTVTLAMAAIVVEQLFLNIVHRLVSLFLQDPSVLFFLMVQQSH